MTITPKDFVSWLRAGGLNYNNCDLDDNTFEKLEELRRDLLSADSDTYRLSKLNPPMAHRYAVQLGKVEKIIVEKAMRIRRSTPMFPIEIATSSKR